jgi:hypothetical protein
MKFLETRIHITKVTMLYKITHNLVAINSDLYISPRTPHTRRSRSLHAIPKPSAPPLTASGLAPSLIQLSLGLPYNLTLSQLLLWISSNH